MTRVVGTASSTRRLPAVPSTRGIRISISTTSGAVGRDHRPLSSVRGFAHHLDIRFAGQHHPQTDSDHGLVYDGTAVRESGAASHRVPDATSLRPRDTVRVSVVVFHSMFGLRDVERAAADRFRAEGHHVVLPDLFDGLTAPGDLDAGFALTSRVGWDTIVARGRRALAETPDASVLLGFSMGVGVIGQLWPERLDAAAVICLHATTSVPSGVPAGTPFQLHIGANDDRFGSTDLVASSLDSARRAGAVASAHRYPEAGHFFTDRSLSDYDADATDLTWTRVLRLLRTLP